MAMESKAIKGGGRKPPAPQATNTDQMAATIDTDLVGAISDEPAETTPAPKAKIQGKVIRKDSPVHGSTQPVAQETIATLPPEDSDEEPVMTAQKPSKAGEAPAPRSPEKAATVLGDYKLLKKLGQGGMGAVYKGQHTSLDRIVAIKILAKELASKESYVKRFLREAKVMANLDHPNILRCIDVKEQKGLHFIVMEFVDGGSVEGWLKKLGKFSVGDALHIVLKTAAALEHAHAKKMIHRDIKPDNILLTSDGIVKVADLGLAKDTSEDTSLTKTGAGAGTPIYMAPEQARDVKHVDARVDIYALGVMMYVFLTGKAPFEGATLVELISAKEKGKFDPIRRHNDEVPTKIDLIVDKMLAKDPKTRYASCQEVIDELEPLGLANDELSFLGDNQNATLAPASKTAKTQGPAAKVAATQAPGPKAGATQGPRNKVAAVTTAPSAPAESTHIEEEDEVAHQNVWYWQMVTDDGKKITKKLSTEQVRALVKTGSISAVAKLSKSATTGYRAAGTFPEFHAAFQALDIASKANVKGHKYRQRYKDIEEEDERRRKYGWISRMFKSFGGFLFGLLWITLILAVVGGAAYFGWKYMNP
ncbi:MAG: protein kinase [Planctomycetes bacterium]|nr:protein kinase [Planctomycetota bacterium]